MERQGTCSLSDMGTASGEVRKRILVVDDDEEVRSFMGFFLNDAGWTVRFAESAESALQAFSEGEFDLVLTDVRMPGMGGIGLLERLRSIDQKVPIVVTTGAELNSDELKSTLVRGAREVIPKVMLFKAIRPLLKELEAEVARKC